MDGRNTHALEENCNDAAQTPVDPRQIEHLVPGGLQNIQGIYPLSALQEAIHLQQLAGNSSASYVTTTLLEFESRPGLESFIAALQRVIDRHDILRSAIVSEQVMRPIQVVYRQAALRIDYIEGKSHAESSAELRGMMRRQALKMDLNLAPLIDLRVATDADSGGCLALLLMHHLITDGRSLEVIIAETVSFMEGKGRELPAPVSFKEHVSQRLKGTRHEAAERFFHQKLGDIVDPTLILGIAMGRTPSTTRCEVSSALEAECVHALRAMARRYRVSVATLIHVAFGLVVSALSGREDLVFGTVLFGRLSMTAGARSCIGMSLNTLPLRLEIGDAPMAEVVTRTQSALFELLRYEYASLSLAQQCTQVTSGSLFCALLNYRHRVVKEGSDWSAIPGARVLGHKGSDGGYPLELAVDDYGSGMSLHVRTTAQIDATRIAGYMRCALSRVTQALQDARPTPVASLSIIPEGECARLITGFNSTAVEYPRDTFVHGLFEQFAERAPSIIAAHYHGRELTYKQLNARANQLARYLRGLGVGPDQLVGLCVRRGLDLVVAVLAILKAGGAYLPLDPDYPVERLVTMCADAAPQVVITLSKLSDIFTPVVARTVLFENCQDAISSKPDLNLSPGEIGLHPRNLAYAIFTSGSTGKPKGTLIEHRGFSNLAHTLIDTMRVTANSRILQFASLSFDACAWECVMALCSGGCLCFADREELMPGEPLADTLRSLRITHATLPPVALSTLSPTDDLHLRVLIVAGEACPTSLVRNWAGKIRMINGYGPTETTICASMHECSPGDGDCVPIGRPFNNSQLYILDSRLKPVPIGAIGELFVGGSGVTRGYMNRPALTAERFVADPFSAQAGTRLYRTGDLARWHAEGVVELVGRADQQVKLRGYRIEPGEIESQLCRIEGIRDALVLVREDSPAEKKLVAYLTTWQNGGDASVVHVEQLRETLRSVLPDYMVPASFVLLPAFPLTPNGKVDRRALLAMDVSGQSCEEHEPPVGPIETCLAEIWRSLLRVRQVGRQDNFFELGGHSLLIARMLEQLRAERLSVGVREIFRSRCLAELAAGVTAADPAVTRNTASAIPVSCTSITPEMIKWVNLEPAHIQHLVLNMPGGAANIEDVYPLTPLQEGILFHHLAGKAGSDVYLRQMLLQVSSLEVVEAFIRSLQLVVNRHDILRAAVWWEQIPTPVHVILRNVHLPVRRIELDPHRDPLQQLDDRMRTNEQSLDLRHAPLLRVEVAEDRTAARSYVILTTHHLICDNQSTEALIAEVMAFMSGHGQTLPAVLSYRDHVLRSLRLNSNRDAEAFFKENLAGIDETTAPFGLRDTFGDGARLVNAEHSLERTLATRIRAHAARLGVSVASMFHAAWALVISVTTAREDIVFGTVLLGSLEETDTSSQTLGMFINTLPFRLSLRGLGVEFLIRRAHEEIADLLAHEQTSLAVAQRCSGMTGSAPLFTALLNYRHAGKRSGPVWSAAPDIQVISARGGTNYPVLLSIDELEAGFGLKMETDRRISPDRMLGYMNSALQEVIWALETTPLTSASTLNILPEGELQKSLIELNRTSRPFPSELLIQQLFEKQASRRPEAIALVEADRTLTYAQLNCRANQLGWYLRSRGVQPADRVIVMSERGIDMVVSLLAVLKCGAVYVPLDPSYPVERARFILSDAAPKVVLTELRYDSVLAGNDSDAVVIAIDTDFSQAAQWPMTDLDVTDLHLTSAYLAYIIYTSGSTGQPKGVAGTHRAMVNRIVSQEQIEPFQDDDICCQKTSIGFIDSIFEILGPLSAGLRLVIASENVGKDAFELAMLIDRQQVTRLVTVPSLARAMVESKPMLESCRTLRSWTLSGETLAGDLLTELVCWLPDCHFINVYGSSEVTADVTYFSADSVAYEDVPIGAPLPNTTIYILDQNLRPAPIGVVGEICVGGEALATGYWNRPDLTAGRFVPISLPQQRSQRIYRTGDLGFWDDSGLLHYRGRADQQIKLRGFRIEIGEIEAQLGRHHWIREAAVLACEDAALREQILTAYVCLQNDSTSERDPPDVEELRSHLAATLPYYMVPSRWVVLSELPRSPNGKLDRRALQALPVGGDSCVASGPLQGEVEPILAKIWAQVLQRPAVGRSDNFFELGGHSLHGVKLMTLIESQLSVRLPVMAIFSDPTVWEMARSIELTLQARRDPPPLPPPSPSLMTGAL